MKVYQVFGSDYGDWYWGNTYLRREDAEAECLFLNKRKQKYEIWDALLDEVSKEAYDKFPYPEGHKWKGLQPFEMTQSYRLAGIKQEQWMESILGESPDYGGNVWVHVVEQEILEQLPEEFR